MGLLKSPRILPDVGALGESGLIADVGAAEFAFGGLAFGQAVDAAAAGAGDGYVVPAARVVAHDFAHLVPVGQHHLAALIDVGIDEVASFDHLVYLAAHGIRRFAGHLPDAGDGFDGVVCQNGVIAPEIRQQPGKAAIAHEAEHAEADQDHRHRQEYVGLYFCFFVGTAGSNEGADQKEKAQDHQEPRSELQGAFFTLSIPVTVLDLILFPLPSRQ